MSVDKKLILLLVAVAVLSVLMARYGIRPLGFSEGDG